MVQCLTLLPKASGFSVMALGACSSRVLSGFLPQSIYIHAELIGKSKLYLYVSVYTLTGPY